MSCRVDMFSCFAPPEAGPARAEVQLLGGRDVLCGKNAEDDAKLMANLRVSALRLLDTENIDEASNWVVMSREAGMLVEMRPVAGAAVPLLRARGLVNARPEVLFELMTSEEELVDGNRYDTKTLVDELQVEGECWASRRREVRRMEMSGLPCGLMAPRLFVELLLVGNDLAVSRSVMHEPARTAGGAASDAPEILVRSARPPTRVSSFHAFRCIPWRDAYGNVRQGESVCELQILLLSDFRAKAGLSAWAANRFALSTLADVFARVRRRVERPISKAQQQHLQQQQHLYQQHHSDFYQNPHPDPLTQSDHLPLPPPPPPSSYAETTTYTQHEGHEQPQPPSPPRSVSRSSSTVRLDDE